MPAETEGKKTSLLFRVIKWLVRVFYIKYEVEGQENLPDEPCIVVGNHTQMHGPLASELYFPGYSYTWCAGEMMHLKEVPEYAFTDFWSQKPKYTHPVYKLLSYLIAPLAVCIFNNANTIGVYRDGRIMSTFKETVKRLNEGARVVIFPEHDVKYNNIVYEFQEGFVDIARLYYRRTGKELTFVPLYIAPKLHKMYLGKPIRYNAAAPKGEEPKRICSYLMDEITQMARSLPEHTVIPYRNIPKKYYPSNLSKEAPHEKAGR